MSKSWIPETIAGFRIARMSRAERLRCKAHRMARSKRTRTIAALVPAFAVGAITLVRMRRSRRASA